eukprot:54793-Pleurochrysis_carterae.AAC.2
MLFAKARFMSMFLSLLLAMAYAYMAFGARVLLLTHHGLSTSLPSRITVDICWYTLSRRASAVAARVLLLVLSMPAALLRLDRQ